MDLTWLDPADPDERDVAGLLGVTEAARRVDSPFENGWTRRGQLGLIRNGWDGEAPAHALLRDGPRPVGALQVWTGEYDNRHVVSLSVVVDPAHRCRGHGTRLLEVGTERGRAAGRTVAMTGGFDTPACRAFARTSGFEAGAVDVHRRLELTTLDPRLVDRLHADARAKATGYELVSMPGPVPDDRLDAVVALTAGINDRPFDDLDVEDEVFTAQRQRDFERAQAEIGMRQHRMVAVHTATGELAGHTQLAVEEDRPWLAYQYDTTVTRAHRGHRLGLLLKTALLRELREVEPQVLTIDTDNAASNDHMIAVNEALGHRVLGTSTEYQRHLD